MRFLKDYIGLFLMCGGVLTLLAAHVWSFTFNGILLLSFLIILLGAWLFVRSMKH